MKPQYTWSIDKIQVAAEEDGRVDVVKAVHWSCSASMNDVVKSTNGIKRFPKSGEIFIEYADLTFNEVIDWVWQNGLKESVERHLLSEFNKTEQQFVEKSLPWI